jgi:hypothetical protein
MDIRSETMNLPKSAIYTHSFDGVRFQTGDVLCTQDGVPNSLFGKIWALMGILTPGEIDHTVIYIGPGGRCVESALCGVIVFDMPGETWDAACLQTTRRMLDRLVGVAFPLAERGLTAEEEQQIRVNVADYCLEKAQRHAPYNLNFFNPQVDGAYYCSQLIYQAYLANGIS